MTPARAHDVAFFTSVAAAISGVGLWQSVSDTRTVEAPAHHTLMADIGKHALIATAYMFAPLARRSQPSLTGGAEQ